MFGYPPFAIITCAILIISGPIFGWLIARFLPQTDRNQNAMMALIWLPVILMFPNGLILWSLLTFIVLMHSTMIVAARKS